MVSSGGICVVLASQPYDEPDYSAEYEIILEKAPMKATANGGRLAAE
jgi:hypothetical protein